MTVSYCSRCGAQLAAPTASCTSCGQVGSVPEPMPPPPGGGTSSPNVKVSLPAFLGPACYFAGWITGLIIITWLRSAPANDQVSFLRFHAAQSVVVFGGLSMIILVDIPIVSMAVIALGIALWLFLMFKASQRQIYKLPVAGDIAETIVKRLA